MLYIKLRDEEWAYEYTDHTRDIVRAVVVDSDGYFHFVRAERDDIFGNAVTVETAGGGVEAGEEHEDAIRRELREELGATVEIIGKIGVVEDYYNLIHRHNVNNYFLCRALSFGATSPTEDEVNCFHISPICLSFDEAVAEYEKRAVTSLGRLLKNRELPILLEAKRMLDGIENG